MSPSKNKPEAKEPTKKQQAPKPTDTEFYWENGENELVKVQYVNSNIIIDESELDGYTSMIMMSAKFKLKNQLSFRPSHLMLRERLNTDKFLTTDDKTEYVLQLSYYGSNGYGAMGEEFEIIGVNPTIKNTDSSISDIGEAQEFTFKKVIMNGSKFKLKGEIHFYKDYFDMIISKTAFSAESKVRYSIKNKEIISDNHWKHIIKKGTSGEFEYNPNNNQYKNNGGTLSIKGSGYEQLYILNKKE